MEHRSVCTQRPFANNNYAQSEGQEVFSLRVNKAFWLGIPGLPRQFNLVSELYLDDVELLFILF